MSPGSKNGEMNDFYKLLNVFINTHEANTTETKDLKNRIMNNIKQLYNQQLNLTTYNSEKVKDKEKGVRPYKQFIVIDNRDEEPKSTKQRRKQDKKLMMEYKKHYGLS